MLVSTYHLSDTERTNARRLWVAERPLVIGSAADCHVVVDDPEVEPRHLRVTDGPVVENIASVTIDVDGNVLAPGMSVRVEEGRPIRIGGTIVKVRMQAAPVVTTRSERPPSAPHVIRNPPSPPPMPANPPLLAANPPQVPARPPRPRKPVLSDNPREQELLQALRAAPGDADTRMVYADWLEERGLKAKTELVRLREHFDTFIHRKATDVDWRAVAACTPIEHCGMTGCPTSWDALAPHSVTDFLRGCGTCRKQVPYCADLVDVVSAAWRDAPVVFDAALDRVAAHAAYSRKQIPANTDGDAFDDDPDGYTLDTPPTNFRK